MRKEDLNLFRILLLVLKRFFSSSEEKRNRNSDDGSSFNDASNTIIKCENDDLSFSRP